MLFQRLFKFKNYKPLNRKVAVPLNLVSIFVSIFVCADVII